MRMFFLTLMAAWTVGFAASAQSAPRPAIPPQWSPEAIEANLAAAMEDESRRTTFLNSFLNGQVWVRVDQATLDAATEQQRTGQGRVSLNFFAAEIDDGQRVIFAFTRRELARLAFRDEPDVPLLGMSGEMALRAQSEIGLSLNYNNGPGVVFTKQDIATLLANLRREPVSPPASAPR